MSRDLLLDTGALISLLDQDQPRHLEFTIFFESWKGSVVTSEAVLDEATILLRQVPGGAAACLEFFTRGGATLIPPSLDSLQRCQTLLQDYAELPMDYADATLVALAEKLGTNVVFTTNREHFGVYRTVSGRSFQVVP